MTGLERNADVVKMASYAPMFAKYGNTQWTAANMIWFNNDDYVLTPNYYVQSLFSNNKGDYSLLTEVKLNGIENNYGFRGGFTVGSWGTHNEFKDIAVKTEDTEFKGELDSANTLDKYGYETVNGEWSINEDGSIVQTSDETGVVCFYASPGMNNYTLSLKAKKTAGGEGFQIGVAAADAKNYYRVNIGGWGNTTAKVQRIVDGVSAETGNVAEQSYVGNVHINDNEWYDVKVEVTDYEIKAYLNDEFICSYVKPSEYGPVYASSVYDEETGEVIVKLVNTMDSDVNVGVNTNNAEIASNTADVTVMSGDTSLENSLENKDAIAPKESRITNASNEFTYNAPADSFSIIRLKTDGKQVNSNAYIEGYDDGTFRPDNTITRAEAAAMMFKITALDVKDKYENNFIDIDDNAWYRDYVCRLADNGCISGYDNGTFKPENPITRAEFAVIIGKFVGMEPETLSKFSDVPSTHWAAKYIDPMALNGLLEGYDDGTFKPDNTITRAEAVTMINKALGRGATFGDDFQSPFSDVLSNHWAFNQILAAVQ